MKADQAVMHHKRRISIALMMAGAAVLLDSFKSPGRFLKMWNAERGFGFIQNDAGGPDMYLHASALKEANIDPDAVKIGDRLTYDVSSTGDGKTRASNVQRA